MALRDLGLAPAAFAALTPREFALHAEHHALREETVSYRLAWLAAQLLQPYAKAGRTLTPEQFLGRPLKYLKPQAPAYPATVLDRMLGASS